MKLTTHQNAFMLDLAKLINYIFNCDNGMLVTGGELYRTMEQQQIYFATGKSKTMKSNHLKRLAIDLNFIKNDVLIKDKKTLQQYGDYWESLSPENRWGGNFKTFIDTPHFERNVKLN